MCGIAGWYGHYDEQAPAPVVLRRMIAAIRHRGPDEQGFFNDGHAALAHARLSIIDLAAGQQPMANEDETIWIIFNGEIFNYLELHKDLAARGHVFRTRSDTEVILHMYEEKGEACVDAFNGDFAFALWDKRRNRLMLARDRMGVRPLYYTVKDRTLIFASEIKALLQFPGVSAEIDPIALDECFTFWFPIAPRTAFKDIHQLPPGHVLAAEQGNVSVRPYWQLRFPPASGDPAFNARSEQDIAAELESLLIDATRIRLRADVPVGAYLSGGLDSSVTTALIKLFTDSTLRTFSVCFETPEFDESAYQQEVVRALNTDHQSILCTQEDIGRIFPDVIRHTERPILRTAPAPLYQLASLVRQAGFKVVLTGEGADEILAGYDIFKETKVRRFWAHQPASASRPLLLRRLYPYLAGIQGQPQRYLEAFFRIGLDRLADPLFSHLPRWQMTAQIKALFSPDLRRILSGRDAVEELRKRLPDEFNSWHWLSRAQYLEAALLLPDYILSSQGDRVAMAHAVEGRFPFLDHRLVEFAARIPPRMKIKCLKEKHILRQSVGRYLPPRITHRPKQPYRAPDSHSFFGRTTPDYVAELLSPRAIAAAGYFDARNVERLVSKCRASGVTGFRDNMALVVVLSTQILHHLFTKNINPVSPIPA